MTDDSTLNTAAGEVTAIPKTMGILLIIFGSLYLFTSLLAVVFTFLASTFMSSVAGMGAAAQKGAVDPNSLAALVSDMKMVYCIQGIEKLVTSALSGLSLAAGIGLYRYRAMGLKLAFWWAVAALAYLVAESGIYAGVIIPAMTRFMSGLTGQIGAVMGQGAPGSMFSDPFGSIGIVGNIIMNLIMAVMPVLTIVFMTREKVKRACGVERIL